jgi:hypothetical protein
MAQNVAAAHRPIMTRCLAVLALLFVYGAYLVGATALLATSSTQAQARRWRGGGRGRGRRGRYWGGYYATPYYVAPAPRCYWSRRWRRTICRW